MCFRLLDLDQKDDVFLPRNHDTSAEKNIMWSPMKRVDTRNNEWTCAFIVLTTLNGKRYQIILREKIIRYEESFLVLSLYLSGVCSMQLS